MEFKDLAWIILATALSIMTFSWILARRKNFYSLVDVSWAYGIAFLSLILAALGSGCPSRRILFSVLVSAWGLRLGTHLLLRLKKKFPEEDRRYFQIKQKWQSKSASHFFWFFQFQALSQPLLCLPFLFAATGPADLGIFDGLGVFLSFVGILGETISDSQLKKFKSDPSKVGQVCKIGFWKYSRHPNYFFEWVIWCGFACFGLSSPWGWLSFSSPLVMYLLLNFVTGVPPAEEQSLQSKGELYRAYQQGTNRFFPWIPKKKLKRLSF